MSIVDCPHDGSEKESVDSKTPELGRRKGTLHGGLRASILIAVQAEDRGNPPTDLAMAADEGVHESAISEARRALGIPPSRIRARNYETGEFTVGHGLAYCGHCMVKYKVPAGRGTVQCSMGHGRLVLSDYALVPK